MLARWLAQQLIKTTVKAMGSLANPRRRAFAAPQGRLHIHPDCPLQFRRLRWARQTLDQIGVTHQTASAAVLHDPGQSFFLLARPHSHGNDAKPLQGHQRHDKAGVVALVQNHPITRLQAQLQKATGSSG
jgi:hypothetical protein